MVKKRKIKSDNIKIILYCNKEEIKQYKQELSDLYLKNNGMLKEVFLNKYDTLIINSNKKRERRKELLINNVCLETPASITINLIDKLITNNELNKYTKEIFLNENTDNGKIKLLREFLKIGIKENNFSKIIEYINCTNIFDKQKIIKDFASEYFKEELEKRAKEKNVEVTKRIKNLCQKNYIIQHNEFDILKLLNKYCKYGELLNKTNPNQDNRSIDIEEKLSTETILQLVKEILNCMTPTGELLNYFDECLNNGKVVIYDKENENINKTLKKKLQCDKVDYYYKNGVIYCPLQHNLFDVICIVHELGHLYNHYRIKDQKTKDKTLMEFSSIFFESFATLYLNSNKSMDEKTKEVINNFRINSNAVTTYMLKKEIEILKVFLRDNEINNKNVLELNKILVDFAEEKTDYNRNDVYDASNYIYNNVIYNDNINVLFDNIGYIVGMELSNRLICEKGMRKSFDIVFNTMDKINSKEYKTEDVIVDLIPKTKTLTK